MKGHWRGNYNGSNVGEAIIEVDDRGSHFAGCAYAYDNDPQLPAIFACFETPDKATNFEFDAKIEFLHPENHLPTNITTIAAIYPNMSLPQSAKVEGEWSSDRLKMQWTTDIGTVAVTELRSSRAADRSECKTLSLKNWDEFKQYATNLEPNRFIFRGQSRPWRLRTAFHRTGRADLRVRPAHL